MEYRIKIETKSSGNQIFTPQYSKKSWFGQTHWCDCTDSLYGSAYSVQFTTRAEVDRYFTDLFNERRTIFELEAANKIIRTEYSPV